MIEDENDGYRSSMNEVRIIKEDSIRMQLLDEVEICASNDISGYELQSTTDRFVWVKFGTENSDDYYPCFCFEVNARPPIEDKIKKLIK